MKPGRLHLAGPDAWPDHVLDYTLGNLIIGLVFQVRGFAIGVELQRTRWAVWMSVYLGFWAFELYLDVDRSWEDA